VVACQRTWSVPIPPLPAHESRALPRQACATACSALADPCNAPPRATPCNPTGPCHTLTTAVFRPNPPPGAAPAAPRGQCHGTRQAHRPEMARAQRRWFVACPSTLAPGVCPGPLAVIHLQHEAFLLHPPPVIAGRCCTPTMSAFPVSPRTANPPILVSNPFVPPAVPIARATHQLPPLCSCPHAAHMLPTSPSLTLVVVPSRLSPLYADKKPYEDLAEQDKERYRREMENYVPTPGYERKKKRCACGARLLHASHATRHCACVMSCMPPSPRLTCHT